jgi:hypothetical protein
MTAVLHWVLWAALRPVVGLLGVLDDLALRMGDDDPWDVL